MQKSSLDKIAYTKIEDVEKRLNLGMTDVMSFEVFCKNWKGVEENFLALFSKTFPKMFICGTSVFLHIEFDIDCTTNSTAVVEVCVDDSPILSESTTFSNASEHIEFEKCVSIYGDQDFEHVLKLNIAGASSFSGTISNIKLVVFGARESIDELLLDVKVSTKGNNLLVAFCENSNCFYLQTNLSVNSLQKNLFSYLWTAKCFAVAYTKTANSTKFMALRIDDNKNLYYCFSDSPFNQTLLAANVDYVSASTCNDSDDGDVLVAYVSGGVVKFCVYESGSFLNPQTLDFVGTDYVQCECVKSSKSNFVVATNSNGLSYIVGTKLVHGVQLHALTLNFLLFCEQ